jgi:hypothetical protein
MNMNKGELLLFGSLSILIIGALAGEYRSAQELNTANREAESQCKNVQTTACNAAGQALRVSRISYYKSIIQWRRAMIGSVILFILVEILLNNPLKTAANSLIFISLAWIVHTSINGYNDYHMRYSSSEASKDCLIRAIYDLGTDDPTQCDVSLLGDLGI